MNYSNLYQYSSAELAKHQGSWPEIARQCEVSYSWVCKIAHGKIPNPSFQRIERLASCLKKMSRKTKAGSVHH